MASILEVQGMCMGIIISLFVEPIVLCYSVMRRDVTGRHQSRKVFSTYTIASLHLNFQLPPRVFTPTATSLLAILHIRIGAGPW